MASERMTFFWKIPSPFSQWTPCTFVLSGVTYSCAEQAMMHCKALLFSDSLTAASILATSDPARQKALGREVRPFDKVAWEAQREGIVYAINHAKFTQNPAFLEALLQTRGTTLVEASPMDRIWGVGLGAENPAILDRSRWRGSNLLGAILTRLRDDLIALREAPVEGVS